MTAGRSQSLDEKDGSSICGIAVVLAVPRQARLWALLTLQSRESGYFYAELLKLMERIGRLAGHGLDALDLRRTLEKERKYQSWLARHDP